MSKMDVKSIYRNRFSGQVEFRRKMWMVLCQEFLQRFFPSEATVAEIGAGYCEFINSIQAAKKIAVDINPDTRNYADPNVQVIQSPSTDLSGIISESVDRVFTSNFFEHLSHPEISTTLSEIRRVLTPNGMIVILQPNFRYCYKDYYMFFDHISALDHRSMVEVLNINGYTIQKIIPQFMPYTTQGILPNSLILLRVYLRLPFLWKIFGQQMFIVAKH
jgi:ubiquinone/menaquinone biosynthesis C-methylase UbiE